MCWWRVRGIPLSVVGKLPISLEVSRRDRILPRVRVCVCIVKRQEEECAHCTGSPNTTRLCGLAKALLSQVSFSHDSCAFSVSVSFSFFFPHTAKHADNAPVLDTCFSADGSTIFSGGGDKAVRMWQISGQLPPDGVPTQIGVHDAPVKTVGFLKSTNLVVSGGWDRKLKFWDCRSPNPAGVFDMPERVYAMDVRDNLLVVATANRHVLIYNVQGQPREHERKESPLKHQTRCVQCFPDQTGYAIGSIEGRVGIQYVQKPPQGKDSFAFKCHRKDNAAYSVNAIAFHAPFGTFATVGSDGVINFWDKDNKQRLKGFNAISRTVPAAKFNAQGSMFAYASSYDWSQGYRNSMQPGHDIFVHNVAEEEVRPKNKKSGYRN